MILLRIEATLPPYSLQCPHYFNHPAVKEMFPFFAEALFAGAESGAKKGGPKLGNVKHIKIEGLSDL